MVEFEDRRAFLARGVAVATAVTGLAGCTTSQSGGSATRTTRQHTSITAQAENGKLKFVNNTDKAVCSLELESVANGNTIEVLDLPNTHDKLKPHYKFTYVGSDFSQIDSEAIYHVTVTTCDGNESKTFRDIQFDRGYVIEVNSW